MLTVLVDLKVLPLIDQVYTPSDTREEKLDPSHVSDGSLLDQTTWPHLLYTLQSQSIQQLDSVMGLQVSLMLSPFGVNTLVT